MPVILVTDFLIFLLLILASSYVFYVCRRPLLRAPWADVLKNRVGAISFTVLMFYISIAVLDSMHYHPRISSPQEKKVVYSNEIASVFDLIVSHLRTSTEKTYSAPLSAYQYSKEAAEVSNEDAHRDYPRLKYGGRHLTNPNKEIVSDVFSKVLKGILIASVFWIVLLTLITFFYTYKRSSSFYIQVQQIFFSKQKRSLPTILITILVLMIITCVVVQLSFSYHVFGTDKVGQDVFYQALKSIRTGIIIGTITTLVMLPFAIILGIMAGYFGGRVDDIIQYIYTTLNSVPGVLLIAAAILMLHVYMGNNPEQFTNLTERADLRLLFLCMILGITSWTGLCRLLRGESLKLRETEYIVAAKALGVRNFIVIFRHILPNLMHIVLITIVLDFSGLVLAEAVLSYVNIGVDPTTHSWGNMINSARLEMAREPVVWWSLSASLFFMFVLVLFANLFSDVVRDVFDPRAKKHE
ncbi:MAG: ABC transporter permease [Pseudomonadota bacterium]